MYRERRFSGYHAPQCRLFCGTVEIKARRFVLFILHPQSSFVVIILLLSSSTIIGFLIVISKATHTKHATMSFHAYTFMYILYI